MPVASAAAPANALRERWVARLKLRMRRYFVIKALGVTAFVWLFFIAYFHLLRHPAREVFEVPVLAMDRWIPFEPLALPVYLSLWFYVSIGPGLMRNLTTLIVYGLWSLLLCLIGLAIFYTWPTAVPPPPPEVVTHPSMQLLQGLDARGNAWPSMHVASAVFASIQIEAIFRHIGAPGVLRVINLLWVLAIAWSTVAIRQHVVLDGLAGAALGAAVGWCAVRWPGSGRPDPISLRRLLRWLR